MRAASGTIRDWIERHARHTPDKVSHLFADGSPDLTWSGLLEGADAVAASLRTAGATRGESVVTFLHNGRAAILVLFGLFLGGFRATPLNLAAGTDAHRHALRHSGARFAVVDDDTGPDFNETGLTVIDAEDLAGAPPSGQAPLTGDDEALLMYTSGTTGQPKGVLHSHRSLLAGGWNTACAHRLGPDDRGLCILPHYHINGLCVTLMGPLVSGGSVIVCRRFSVQRFWDDCERYAATWFSCVPTIVSRLIHHDSEPQAEVVRRLRFARSASSALPREVHKAFESRFRIVLVETMGLTETAAQILANPLPPGKRKIGSPGIAFGNEVAILDGAGHVEETGQAGEIAVKGPNVMLGYLDDEEATRDAFTKDGWLKTGDVGFMDRNGYVHVSGRLKELIIKGGENIAPREVDDALHAHPEVIEAAAFARPCPDYGQRVEAAVCLARDATVTTDELITHCRARLGAFRSPDRIHVLADLPRGPSGKVQRIRLSGMLQAQTSTDGAREVPCQVSRDDRLRRERLVPD